MCARSDVLKMFMFSNSPLVCVVFCGLSVIINSGGALKSVYPGLELAALKIFLIKVCYSS